ncbi:TetR/AcrR family transcriptional regulator [Sinimarinibacterium sp. NLF-5-8]|uniref:TetR/AcrR family transcriptional regulator n=1 Tax=Sinimarinibacterium sp. NLF-5-8 TaxID=2698684 RepID=UPI00137BD9EA|nr:TetR/AcrR family transcriptional regulator [Sinimarinibacterium sp. NLF-5-8]QHS11055.1 TetR/AcrR family transcriptional regulator [Sinimarinibacterium sp. NLF-5-8]
MARQQLSAEAEHDMRCQLVDAGLALYRSAGLEAVSLRRLADAVGISHTLPYRYFADKDALLAAMRCACVRAFDQALCRSLTAAAAPETHLRRFAAAYVDYACQHTADYLLIFTTEQPPPSQYPALLAARQAPFERAVVVVQAAIDAELIDGEARTVAHQFWIMLHGLMTLHAANQLVHGRTVTELIDPLLTRILTAHRRETP